MIVVVPLVAVKFGGPPAAWSAAGPDWWDAADQGLKPLAVVEVGAGDAERQRQTVPVGDQVDFRSELAAAGRIRSRQKPALWAGRDDLIDKLDTYVIGHNTTAKPYRWTYDGSPLKAA